MSVDKFKFISPGIFVNEIDNTGRTAIAEDVGPVLIGRSEKGPILQPIRVNSYFDFINAYGNPIPGGKGGDVARDGNFTSPTYAAYAAQAWFRNNAPVTFVRIGGKTNQNATDLGGAEHAGWQTTTTEAFPEIDDNGGAYGLFVADAPTLAMGSGTITCTTGAAFDPANIQTGDTIKFVVNDSVGTDGNEGEIELDWLTITASCPAQTNKNDVTPVGDIPDGGHAGFGTGSSDTECAQNITGAWQTALTAAGADYNDWTVGISEAGVAFIQPGTKFMTASGAPTLKMATWNDTDAAGATGVGFSLKVSQYGMEELTANDTTSSNISGIEPLTGTLAAVWYIDKSASIGLSGTEMVSGENSVGSSIYIGSVGQKEFKVQVSSTLKGVEVDSSFNFTNTSDNYIRKVFNTNPILTNTNATDSTSNSFARYWLGESYEGAVHETLEGTSHVGVILPLISGSSILGGKYKKEHQPSKTGFFFAQDVNTGESSTGSYAPESMQTLFRLVARDSGDWLARNLKVSIKDIRAPRAGTAQKYGSFTVLLRSISDTDNRINPQEQFNNCNLNPNSQNFIARKIGNKRLEWSDSERRYKELGDYPSLSKYVWVELPDAVLKGDTDPEFLPFGVKGPLRFTEFNDETGSSNLSTGDGGGRETMVSGNIDDYGSTVDTFISGAEVTNGLLQFEFPKLRLRTSASEGNPVDPLNSFFGVDTTFNSSRLDASVRDHLKIKPTDIDDFSVTDGDHTEISWHFTLDDMCSKGAVSNKTFVYKSGSRASTSSDAGDPRDGLTYVRGTGSYREVLDAGIDRYTTVFHGGFDGLDITESEPLRIVNDGTHDDDVKTNYMFNSVQVALDSIRDAEVVEYNVAAMPGIINSTLNLSLIDLCESRGDALAVVDVKGGYTSQYESTDDESSRRGNVDNTINELKLNLVTNSSYGAAYYPWVQIRDLNNGQIVWVPPSVPALGAISYSQRASELWFAPAGFTRGGLSTGNAGLPVVGVRDKLTSRDRDKLYEGNINPIAQFPAEGIVIFGQKTLQASASALDRINVRRLMIFLKRQISRFAATILFDQNVRVTWNRFKGQVEPFLRGVQAGLGITEFKLVLDETTTTPDLIDRNVLYAKIYIKPARAIEYIAIDFILTDSGAAFED